MDKTNIDTNKNIIDNNSTIAPVTSPISQGKLVTKVNALTSKNAINSVSNTQNIIFNQEKNLTLSHKKVFECLISAANIDNPIDLYNKVYLKISQCIDSKFYAIGLFKEKSNCINLRLQDKLGNNYSTKVFLKDTDNPIIQVFESKKVQFIEKNNYLNLSYYKDYSTAIIPLISVNKCIGVFIIEDSNARQSAKLYSLIANHIALVTHNFELLEKSDELVNTDSLTLLYNHRGFQEILTNEKFQQVMGANYVKVVSYNFDRLLMTQNQYPLVK